ncbi:MAG: hypothetical protein ABIK28_09860 [Planctomycetota bacterium]
MCIKDDGSNIAIKIGESPVIEYNANKIFEEELRREHLKATFTATATGTGYSTMEMHLWRVADDETVTQYIDNIHIRLLDSTFEAVNAEVRYQTGGAFDFNINAGPEHAHQMYVILQGFTGCLPGFTVGSEKVNVPLNWDFWTETALNLNPYWCNFYGILDSEGKASAEMSTFGPLPSSTNALSLQLVALVFDASLGVKPVFATNPTNVLITQQ